MKKRILSILLLMCLTVGAFAVMPLSASAEVGADADIVINSVDDWMNKLSGKTIGNKTVFVNAKVLDFEGKEVLPIEGFKGHFNGNGVIIKNMEMITDGETGIFHCIEGAVIIENLVIEESYFYGVQWVGSVVCCIGHKDDADNAIIRNIYVGQNVNVEAAGKKSGSNINVYAGGIIGGIAANGGVDVTDCVFEGEVSCEQSDGRYMSGIVGNINSKKNVTVYNCLSTGTITNGKSSNISGIMDGSNTEGSKIDYCISILPEGTNIKDSYKYSGGVAKGDCNWSKLENVYGIDALANDPEDETNLIGKFTVRENDVMIPNGVKALETLNDSFTVPSSVYYNTVKESVALRGDGTESSPYLIATATEWLDLAAAVSKDNLSGKFVKLEADIDFTGVTVAPISEFSGTLDGDGYAIKNLTMVKKNAGDVALFCGLGDNATVKNLLIRSSVFEIEGTGNWIGTVCCCTNGKNVTISNVYVDKDVEVNAGEANGNSIAGGILGGVYGKVQASVTIDSCVFAGIIEGTGDNVAGIIASVEQNKAVADGVEPNSVVVSNCVNLGTVRSEGDMVAGIAIGQGMTVKNCINVGKVSGGKLVADIVASNPYSAVVVDGCYHVGEVLSAIGAQGETNVTYGTNTRVELNEIIGLDAVAPEGFTKRDGDVSVPAGVAGFAPVWYTVGQKYTVIWKNGGLVIETDECELGDIPSYDGETPTRDTVDDTITYIFVGWSPEISPVVGDVTYVAQFDFVLNEPEADGEENPTDPEETPDVPTAEDTEAESETEPTPVVKEKNFLTKIFDAIINFFKNLFASIFGKDE